MRLATTEKNATLSEVLGDLNAAVLRFYSGTRPDSVDDLPTGTVLASVPLGSPSFGSPVDGSIEIAGTPSAVATASGTAAFATLLLSDGVTPVCDFAIGATGTPDVDITLPTLDIAIGVIVAPSGTVTVPDGR
jgi:hypothetical protein